MKVVSVACRACVHGWTVDASSVGVFGRGDAVMPCPDCGGPVHVTGSYNATPLTVGPSSGASTNVGAAA